MRARTKEDRCARESGELSSRESDDAPRNIRCSWSTSCLTEHNARWRLCNVCLRHGGRRSGGGRRGQQRAEQPGGRRRTINHSLGRSARSIPRRVGRGLLSRTEKLTAGRVDGRRRARRVAAATAAGRIVIVADARLRD